MELKLFALILGLFLSTYTIAAPGPDLKSFSCESFNGDTKVEGTLSESCQDARYTQWNPTGCFEIEVFTQGTSVYKKEFIRDFKARETQQGFYTFYDWDQENWVLDGLIIRLQSSADGTQEYRLDTRGNSRDQMIVASRGSCTVL